MPFIEELNRKDFLRTVELVPPRGTDVTGLLRQAEKLAPFVDAFNLPDNPGARLHAAPIGIAFVLQSQGFESIYQVTCRDRNRLALQADLLAAGTLGIRNVLVVTGDHNLLGDHPTSKPVYDLDSVQLLTIIKNLNKGLDANGQSLDQKTIFCYGAVVNPSFDNLKSQLEKLKLKVEAGISFVQTQAVFDYDAFKLFMENVKQIPVKVLAGILPLRSARMASWINRHVAGVSVPAHIIRRLETAKDPVGEGWRIVEETIDAVKEVSDGLHFMSLGDSHGLTEYLKSLL
ncbi:methylenetetrahydrofolate reductase [Paradesulfitobacterium ferrireducens]|uniref:methylenetetrahydrofolate reductase n=1 Tax=Paradesulfitobacterium ferrireducens TaxID=2816476 RepID=UPI001A908EEE|nr:methylenetetrahydrofolate reductase [Paradesulfitobacterium ferrireducens]